MRWLLLSGALAAGFLIDYAFGDPKGIPHPVVLIGKWIAFLESRLRRIFPKTKQGELQGGITEVVLVCLTSWGIPFLLTLLLNKRTGPGGVFVFNAVACGHLLAARSLKTESMLVYDRLKNGTLNEAREAVSRIVGRDTKVLDEDGITRAAVETVAENTSDGVLAPMFYMAVGGAPFLFLYKAINTMDSMLGYKNEKYLYFGKAAARLDDVVNFIPSRISGILMILAAFVLGGDYDGRNAFRIFLRDRKKHASPNSAQTESAMAGAMKIRLAGDAYYFGELYKKPTIGDPIREISPEDIPRANRLMYVTSAAGLVLFSGLILTAGILLR